MLSPEAGRYETCEICGKPILPGEPWTIYKGKKVHYECFKRLGAERAEIEKVYEILKEKVDGLMITSIIRNGVYSDKVRKLLSKYGISPAIVEHVLLRAWYSVPKEVTPPPEYMEEISLLESHIREIIRHGLFSYLTRFPMSREALEAALRYIASKLKIGFDTLLSK